MERFFDEMDQENSKAQGKGQISKKIKNKKEKNGGKKKKRIFFTNVEVPILACSPLVRNTLKLSPLCNPPS
jgi:hypothetical protein